MRPVLTPEEMAAVDAAAPDSIDQLVDRAGRAVARVALDMLGGAYGRVVRVIVGKGNNGNDGRVAAKILRARGVQVEVIEAATTPSALGRADLVIDAAYGTGFRGGWTPPSVGGAPVLAVDIPSGVDALDGTAPDSVLAADRTVTFQALKPGLLFGAGARLAGRVEVADIGLDVSAARTHLIDAGDVRAWWPSRPADAHKWRGAVRVVAGSTTMPGAGALCADAAARSGAGLVKVSAVGVEVNCRPEVMRERLDGVGWSHRVLDGLDRFAALAIGPGLARAAGTRAEIVVCVRRAATPVVIDGDGLFALAHAEGGLDAVVRERSAATVLTPHDGEFSVLTGELPGGDRIEATRSFAVAVGCVVLLKGPTTVIAGPDGAVLLVDRGDQRLATAGSGDVLTGVIGTALASGMPPLQAAAAAAWLHADAGARLQPWGSLAGDLLHTLPEALAGVLSSP